MKHTTGLRKRISYAVRGTRLMVGLMSGRPAHCIVQVSNRCNLSCGFCSFWENPAHPKDELSTADFSLMADKLGVAGSMVVSIEGGEPLLRPDIVDIVSAFSRQHHPILFTNGWRMTRDLAHRLWSAGLDTIGVSIDYPDADRHDKHRGKAGTLTRARRALDILAATAPMGARQVFAMTVLMNDNADAMPELLELSGSHGVGHQITLISTGGGGRHDRAQSLPRPGVGRTLLALKSRHPHFMTFSGYLEGIDEFLSGNPPPRCFAGERFINIDHLGYVSPCIEKLDQRAGNLVAEPWPIIASRLRDMKGLRQCGDCFTSCRGFVDEMSGVPQMRSWREFFSDFTKAPRTQ